MKKRLNGRETLLIATMLFGMFFGAGNLIFPVYMGQLAGRNIWKAIAGFIITGVSMPLLGVAAIGGKDSMSGTFNQIDVPPTLVSFAVDVAKCGDIITPELKKAGSRLVRFEIEKDDYDVPVYEKVMELYDKIAALIADKVILSAYATDANGVAAAVSKMAFGNGLGVKVDPEISAVHHICNGDGGTCL